MCFLIAVAHKWQTCSIPMCTMSGKLQYNYQKQMEKQQQQKMIVLRKSFQKSSVQDTGIADMGNKNK